MLWLCFIYVGMQLGCLRRHTGTQIGNDPFWTFFRDATYLLIIISDINRCTVKNRNIRFWMTLGRPGRQVIISLIILRPPPTESLMVRLFWFCVVEAAEAVKRLQPPGSENAERPVTDAGHSNLWRRTSGSLCCCAILQWADVILCPQCW